MFFDSSEKVSKFKSGYSNCTLVYHSKTDLFYLFGGFDVQYQVNTNFTTFDPKNNTWTTTKSESSILERYNHTCVAFSDYLVIFGGVISNDRMCQPHIHIYHVLDESWTSVKRDFQPTSRQSHSATIYNDCMYIFGGRDLTHMCDNMYKFDLISNFWSLVKIKSKSQPNLRFGHQSVTIDNCMYLFGGLVPSQVRSLEHQGKDPCDSELWKFDYTRRIWTRIEYSGGPWPSPRVNFAMNTLQGFIILQGGQNVQDIFSDCLVYDVKYSKWITCRLKLDLKRNHSITIRGKDSIWCFGGNSCPFLTRITIKVPSMEESTLTDIIIQ